MTMNISLNCEEINGGYLISTPDDESLSFLRRIFDKSVETKSYFFLLFDESPRIVVAWEEPRFHRKPNFTLPNYSLGIKGKSNSHVFLVFDHGFGVTEVYISGSEPGKWRLFDKLYDCIWRSDCLLVKERTE